MMQVFLTPREVDTVTKSGLMQPDCILGDGPAGDFETWAADGRREARRVLREMASGSVELAARLDAIARDIMKAAVHLDAAGTLTEARTALHQLSLMSEWLRHAGDKMSAIVAGANGLIQPTNPCTAAFAEEIGALSRAAAVSSEAPGKSAGTFSRGEARPVGGQAREDATRRRDERVPGNGAPATLIVSDGSCFSAVIRDISRGGAALFSEFHGKLGEGVLVTVPGLTEPVRALVIRHADGVVAVAFCRDERTMAEVDAVVDMMTEEPSAPPSA